MALNEPFLQFAYKPVLIAMDSMFHGDEPCDNLVHRDDLKPKIGVSQSNSLRLI